MTKPKKKRLPKACLRCGGPISKKWAKIIVNHLVSENQICEKCHHQQPKAKEGR